MYGISPPGLILLSPALLEEWSGYLSAVLVVLLMYQQWRLHQLRRRITKREEVFRIVAENAADMIALVDGKGRRLYNSPAYLRVLGYTSEELERTPALEQIHPEDRYKVLEGSREAFKTGAGKKLEYRIRHKNGTWRVVESTASTILDNKGDVEKLVIINRDITDRKHAQEVMERNSTHDELTGLPNRHLLLDRVQRCFVRARRSPEYQYAVLLVDVDGFKEFNQEMGTTAGNRVITEMGARLASCLREYDTVARPGNDSANGAVLSRLGGDEFTVLLEGITEPSDAMRVAQRIQTTLAAPVSVAGGEFTASASVGIALSLTDHASAEDLLQCADTALRRAKSLGGMRCEVYDEGMHILAVNRLRLEADLRTALEQGQFQLYYQPIFNLRTRQVMGFEALVRWHHPERGVVAPSKFIEVAERAGLIIPLERWAIREACQQLQAWQSMFPSSAGLNMTVNVSRRQFADARILEELRGTFQETRVEPARLQLEIAGTDAMTDPKRTSELTTQLKQLGVAISIGEFGTGNLPLGWLRRLPLNELKIDRTLVASMPTDRASSDIVKLIVILGCEFNLRIIGQGIETAVQLARLKETGCELGQGYLLSKPLVAEQAGALLQQQSDRGLANAAGHS